MALPYSRNETATPGDEVPSNTINDLQDGEVANKHGWIWRPLPAAKFIVKFGGGANYDSGEWTANQTTAFVCPLELDVGTLVRAARFGYNRANLGNVSLKWGKRNIVTGAAAVVTTVFMDNSGAAWETYTIDDFSVPPDAVASSLLIEADHEYWLEVLLDSAGQKLGGAFVEHSRP